MCVLVVVAGCGVVVKGVATECSLIGSSRIPVVGVFVVVVVVVC